MKSISSYFKNFSKKSYNLNSILYNRILLYVFLVAAVVDVFYLSNIKDYGSIIVLLVVGFLTTFFSKNMIVVLVIALTVTHVLRYGTGTGTGISEGLENQDDDSETKDTKNQDGESDKKKDDKNGEEVTLESLKNEFSDFQSTQSEIKQGIGRLEPLLANAERFIQRYETYKNQEGMKVREGARGKGAKKAGSKGGAGIDLKNNDSLAQLNAQSNN